VSDVRVTPRASGHLVPFFSLVGVLWLLCFALNRPWHWYALCYMGMAVSILHHRGSSRRDAPVWVLVFLGVPALLLVALLLWLALRYYAT
jgi:hypothetical protein